MRARVAPILMLATLLSTLAATTALAQVDVELAFTPDEAAPGQQVTLFASIANLSSEPVHANFTVAIAFGMLSIPPMPFTLPLAAGLERSAEIPFVVPPLPMGGKLVVTVTATAAGATDTATATLNIVAGALTSADSAPLRAFGTTIGKSLGGSADVTATNDASMSDIKRLYR